jgi:hypothetical protein
MRALVRRPSVSPSAHAGEFPEGCMPRVQDYRGFRRAVELGRVVGGERVKGDSWGSPRRRGETVLLSRSPELVSLRKRLISELQILTAQRWVMLGFALAAVLLTALLPGRMGTAIPRLRRLSARLSGLATGQRSTAYGVSPS